MKPKYRSPSQLRDFDLPIEKINGRVILLAAEMAMVVERCSPLLTQPKYNLVMSIWGIGAGFEQLYKGLKLLEEEEYPILGYLNLINGGCLIAASLGTPFGQLIWLTNSFIDLTLSILQYYFATDQSKENQKANWEKIKESAYGFASMVVYSLPVICSMLNLVAPSIALVCPIVFMLMMIPLLAQAFKPKEDEPNYQKFCNSVYGFFSKVATEPYTPAKRQALVPA